MKWLLLTLLFALTLLGLPKSTDAAVRYYRIAAEEVEWDYLPTNMDCMSGFPLDTCRDMNMTANGTMLASNTTMQCPSLNTSAIAGSGRHHTMRFPKLPSKKIRLMDGNHDNGPLMNAHDPLTWVCRNSDRIGRRYKKMRYVAYDDEFFREPSPILPEREHLGIMGPLIRAEVGDEIKITFWNKGTKRYSIHMHGVFYNKESEGAPYADGSGEDGDAIVPGGLHLYEFKVPESAGPGPDDPSSVVWLYHSHHNEVMDVNSGLFGPVIITRRGMAKPDGAPMDVDREFVISPTVFDENEAVYYVENARNYLIRNETNLNSVEARIRNITDDMLAFFTLTQDAAFIQSNQKHTINGYLYANVPGLIMFQGERVRWYTIALGSEEGLHTVHWHGLTVLSNRRRTDVIELLPASMRVADMIADNVGIWMMHCHVNHHIHGGMTAIFSVREVVNAPPMFHLMPAEEWTYAIVGLAIGVPMAVVGALFFRTYWKRKNTNKKGFDRLSQRAASAIPTAANCSSSASNLGISVVAQPVMETKTEDKTSDTPAVTSRLVPA